MAKFPLTQDEVLRPVEMGCINCGGRMTVYPCPLPKGTGYCPCTSPTWLEPFAKWMMNQERQKRGLTLI